MSCVTRTVSLVFAACSVVFVRGWVPKSGRLLFFGLYLLVGGSRLARRAGFFLLVTAKGRLELAGAREDEVRAAPGRKGETATA